MPDIPFTGIYRARCTNVVDGDTVDLVIDLGFHLTATVRVRLLGINTPEMVGKDREKALEAKKFVQDRLLDVGTWSIKAETKRDPDSFGRYLATIWYGDKNLNQELVDAGLAVEYRR